jgi:hypothetical protein
MNSLTDTATCAVDGCDGVGPLVQVGDLAVALCPDHEAKFEANWHLGLHASGLDDHDSYHQRGRLI